MRFSCTFHRGMASTYDRHDVFANGSTNGAREKGALLYGPGDRTTGMDQLRESLRLLWRRKWMFLAVTVLVAGAVAGYTFALPDVYRTSSLLLVEPDQDAASEDISLQLSGMSRQENALSNEMLVINQSNELARRVARRLLKMQDVPETGEPFQILRTESGKTLSSKAAAERLLSAVQARSGGRDVDAIRISATGNQAAEAAAIANVYAEEYIERSREESRADLRSSRSFLEAQAERTSGRLDSLEGRLSDYMSENSAAALDEEASRTVERIATLEATRDEARIELKMKQAALETKENELESIEPRLAERAASNVEAQLKQVQNRLARKEGKLDQIYEENPSLRGAPDAGTREIKQEAERLRARADSLSRKYVSQSLEAGGIDPTAGGGEGSGGQGLAYVAQQRREVAQARIAVNGLEAKINTLNERLAEYRQKLERIPQQSIELAQMRRARQSAEKLYTFIIEKLQETRIREQSKIGYAEVVHPAPVPQVPFKPSTRRNLILGLFLGLLLGGGLVLLRERLDTRLRRPEDVRAQGHDVAGVIPDFAPLIEEDFGGAGDVTVDGRTVSTDLPMLLNPMSGAAEAFRRLRNTIQFSRPDTVVQGLMVTSASPGEGKTTIALNAAIAMAQADRRTLMVDADLHRPRTHRCLGHRDEPGLTDVLFERRPLDTARLNTGTDNLDLLPAGREVPKPAELLGSKKMRAFIDRVREDYDVIVFDTPPVGALSDAMLLSTQCEGTLMVARAGETDARAFAHAVEMLDDVGATLLGGVLNGFDPDREGYGYYHGYGYGYGYGGGRSGYGERREERSSLQAT
jgi:capsular exopolysaccharide synthesis family protein